MKHWAARRSTVEEVAEHPATASAAADGRVDATLAGLHQDPAGALERQLDRLARAAAGQVLERLEVRADRGRNALGPRDRGLCVGEGRRAGNVEHDWRPVGDD